MNFIRTGCPTPQLRFPFPSPWFEWLEVWGGWVLDWPGGTAYSLMPHRGAGFLWYDNP